MTPNLSLHDPAFVGASAAEPLVPFDNFVCKWNSGDATIVVGISRLSYFPSAVDELGCEFGFIFRPYSTNKYSIMEDGVEEISVPPPTITITTSTEFKLTYDGTDMKWFYDDMVTPKRTSPVSLSGTYYLFTNNNNPSGSSDGSIQCQYGGVDATWTGYDGDGASWLVSNPSVTKNGGSSWGTNVYALAQSSTY